MFKYNNKKIFLLFIIIILFISGVIFTYNSYKKNLNKIEISDLININELSDEFLNNYFLEVNNLDEEEAENLLIVISPINKFKTYGAYKIIEAPNNQYYLVYKSEKEKNNALKKLKKNKDILSVSENETIELDINDEIKSYNLENVNDNYNSYAIEEFGYDKAIEAVESLENTEKVVVAIIDTGLDVNTFNINYPNKLEATYDINDVDGSFSNEINDVIFHGTHVAGTIAEATPENVKIIAIKAANVEETSLSNLSINYAFNYAFMLGVDVINCSFGGDLKPFTDSIYQNILAAVQNNIIVVASVGNENLNTDEIEHFPGGFEEVISVANIDSRLEKYSESSYGKVDFAATGFNIKSIPPSRLYGTGTSMAAPHVSSAVAILKSFNKDLTKEQIVELLKKYSIDVNDDGKDKYYGYGAINFNGAEFCTDGIDCDEYGVFKNSDVNGLSTIRIEAAKEKFTPEYNYGSITNIIDAEINLYYTKEHYYTKTLGQLIENIEISEYDPYKYEEQEVIVRYKKCIEENQCEVSITVDNSKINTENNLPQDETFGWEYSVNNNEITLTGIKYNEIEKTDIPKSYNELEYPEVIYIPREIYSEEGKIGEVVKLGNKIFYDKLDLKVVVLPNSLTEIESYAFGSSIGIKTQSYSRFHGPVKIILPDEMPIIASTTFYNRRPNSIILYYTGEKDDLTEYVSNSKQITYYLYNKIPEIEILDKNYKAFETINPQTITLKTEFAGKYCKISAKNSTTCSEYNDSSFEREMYGRYTIKYQNGDSLRYGDTGFILSYETDMGYKIEKEIPVTVEKAIPEYDLPTNIKSKKGKKLSTVELPEGFIWRNEDTLLSIVGKKKYSASYVPSDINNYKIINDIEIEVEVEDVTIIPEINVKDEIYDSGESITLENIKINNLENNEYAIKNFKITSNNVGETTAKVVIKLSDEKYKYVSLEGGLQEKEYVIPVKIYGIKKISDDLLVKDGIIISKNNNFKSISEKIEVYGEVVEYKHFNEKEEEINDDTIKTNDKIKIKLNGKREYQYSISSVGDINADGKISSADYVKIRKHIMQSELIKEYIYFYAADINVDEKITSADYVKIRKYIMNEEVL